jgi:chemotaxis protein MotB
VADGRVTVTGYADTKPLTSNDSPQGRAKNRRIEVIINSGS